MTRFHKNGSDSARSQAAVTPSNTVNHATGPARGLYVGTGGNVVVVAVETGGAQTWANVPSGFIIPLWNTRVNATGTTASNILALYD